MKKPFQFLITNFRQSHEIYMRLTNHLDKKYPTMKLKVYKTDNRYLHKQYVTPLASLLFKMEVIFNIVQVLAWISIAGST